MPARVENKGNAVFAALANPERRRILELLRAGDKPAGSLVAEFPDLPQPAVSRHLRVLREAGLVTVTSRAQQRIYALEPGKLREVDSWVSTYREFWSGRLALLSGHLDENRKSGNRAGQDDLGQA